MCFQEERVVSVTFGDKIIEKKEKHSLVQAPGLEPLLEERVEELRHRLRIEAAVVEGAKNVIRLLQSARVPEKRALQETELSFKYVYHDAC
ncbi:hypothetical protein B566_EDAN000951 [Ephemera danica]|nr:hypothetical protein B566_EDAN000951 [Ephemera danica]